MSTPTTNIFDISAISREGLSPLETSRILRAELQRLLTDLMQPGVDLYDEATQQRISDAEYEIDHLCDYLGETLPGPPNDDDEADDFDYDDDDAHAPANNEPDARPVRFS